MPGKPELSERMASDHMSDNPDGEPPIDLPLALRLQTRHSTCGTLISMTFSQSKS